MRPSAIKHEPKLKPQSLRNRAADGRSTETPLKQLLTENSAFDPETTKAMTTAYDHLYVALHLVDRDDSLKETVAKKLVEHARQGERNAIALAQLVLKDLGLTS
jgi:hypothetical protein